MLKEVCITPQVFDKEHINSSNWKDIKNVLENILESGYILGLNNKDWIKEVRENINKIESIKIRDCLNDRLTSIQNRNRIYGHPKGSFNINTEDDCLLLINELNEIRTIFSIIATKKYNNNIISVDYLEDLNISQVFGLTGSKHYIKNEEALKNIFLPLLSYARKLTIIDPYFNVNEDRYKTTLNFISKLFKERRGFREKGSIIINCKWNEKFEYELKNWQKILDKIYKDFGHTVKIQCWSRKGDNELKLHERYILTDSAGIFVGAGTDKDDYQQSEWCIKDYDQLDEIRNQYEENVNCYKLEYIVTASEIKKSLNI